MRCSVFTCRHTGVHVQGRHSTFRVLCSACLRLDEDLVTACILAFIKFQHVFPECVCLITSLSSTVHLAALGMFPGASIMCGCHLAAPCYCRFGNMLQK